MWLQKRYYIHLRKIQTKHFVAIVGQYLPSRLLNQIGKKNLNTDFYFILDLHERFVSFSKSHSSLSDIHLFKTRYLNFFFFVRKFGSGFTGKIEFGSEKRLSLNVKKSTCVKMLVTLCGSAITNVFPVSMKRLEEK
jgi:hypothetical protein